MGLAGMVVAGAHEPAGSGNFRHHAAAGADSKVDVIEDFGDLWTTFERLSHSVGHVPDIDRGVNQLGYLGFVSGRDLTQSERIHKGSPLRIVSILPFCPNLVAGILPSRPADAR